MAMRRYGVAELAQLIGGLSKPVADAWRAESGPGWWGRVKARAAGWLRRAADRIAPAAATLTVALAVALPTPAMAPRSEPVPAAKPVR